MGVGESFKFPAKSPHIRDLALLVRAQQAPWPKGRLLWFAKYNLLCLVTARPLHSSQASSSLLCRKLLSGQR